MPSFLKDLSLRRRSRVSSKNDKTNTSSSDISNDGTNDEGSQSQTKSSSTLSPSMDRVSLQGTLSSPRSRSSMNLPNTNGSANGYSNGNKTPPMPGQSRTNSSPSTRYSIVASSTPRGGYIQNIEHTRVSYTKNLQGLSSQNGTGPKPTPPTSPLAPRVLSISDNSWVHQKVLLISGTLGEPQPPVDGTVTLNHRVDNFPATHWPVCDSHFKALVHLQPGPNRIRLDFTSPRLPANPTSVPAHSSWININFLPLINAPPLQLVILVAKDSPETFDAVPERVQREGNTLAVAIRKYRMAAYLWQAFTAEQMHRAGFGRRCYRYEEEWQPGTLTYRDFESGQMRNEAKVHVVRMGKTVAEIRDLEIAQQYQPAKEKGKLFDFALDAVRAKFAPRPGQTQYVSCLYLDTHWDKKVGTIRGHAALGGGSGEIKLAIFGSQALQSYPAHIEEVVPAFSDCTRTDTNYVANDCNEGGSSWEAVNIGIGAHMHEVGHLLGCPHQENGVMLRDYVRLNRTFTCREPYSTRTKQQGQWLCLPKDECAWHRLDVLRFRFHPAFQLPTDQLTVADNTVQVWAVDNGTVLVTAASGVAWIELYPEGDDVCHHWIEYLDQSSGSPIGAPRQVSLNEQDLRGRLTEDKRKRKLKIKVFSCGGGDHEVADFSQLAGKAGKIKLPSGRPGFRSSKLGASQMEGSKPQELIFASSWKQTKLMLSVKVYHGNSLDGIEFLYEDGESELFGKRGGRPGGSEFSLDTRRGEVIIGFYLRAGFWIDGIQILTNQGRRSEIYGNKTSGSGHTLVPPRGYSIAGVYGSCGPWLDGFGLIITR